MDHYYGVVRSDSNTLSHYGIKGMRWGVRKAIKNKDVALLSKHHSKAMHKLAKLKTRADVKEQKENAKAYAALGALGIGAGALGGLASYGIVKGQVAAQRALMPNSKTVTLLHPVGLYGMSALSAGGGLASLGASVASAYRSTKHGNKNAIKKYNKFKTEMNNTFKGTRFGKNGYASRITKQIQKDAKEYLKRNSGSIPDASKVSGNYVVHPMVPYIPNSNNRQKKGRR